MQFKNQLSINLKCFINFNLEFVSLTKEQSHVWNT